MNTRKPLAPHVQAVIAATAQPRTAAGPRPAPAAHVRAAVAQARLQAPRPAPPVQKVPAPVHGGRATVPPPPVRWNPAAGAAPPPPPGLPAPVQAKPSPAPPGVVQPARKRKRTPSPEPRKRRKTVSYAEEDDEIDRIIERMEQRDIEEAERKHQQNLEKYKSNLSKEPPQEGSKTITYVRSGKKKERRKSLPISKDLMSRAYGEAMTKSLDSTLFHIDAPSEEGSLTQHFVLRPGHDYVLFSLAPVKDDEYRQEGNAGPSFTQLAFNADEAAAWLKTQDKKNYGTLKKARIRVARDVNRMAGGRRPRIEYPVRYLAGAHGLTTFAAVIRADKGRVLKATKYIEMILKDSESDFGSRFGGEKPTYIGTGKGSGRGPVGLRKKGEDDPGELSEYSDDESK